VPTIEEWEQRYETGFTPWDIGRPDRHLIQIVEDHPVPPGRALEVGCGTGTNAIWLAEQGFEVLATDVSALALKQAREKVAQAGAAVTLLQGSFPSDGAPFAFAFDRGCFHSFDDDTERADFAAQLASQLEADGLWLSIIGSTDGPPRDHGPPRRSAQQVTTAVEPRFEILSLQARNMDANVPTVPRAWICLMKKRTVHD
jgi:SAM-dependent methyltransferase